MKSPHLKADPTLSVDPSAHGTDANQTWSGARGEVTEPGPPPRLDPSTGLGRDDDGARTQPELIGPGGKLVGFGGLRPDVKVQAESAGRSAARYEANAAPARSVLPVEANTSRRVVVNQTQPMGLPAARNDPAPGSATTPIAAPIAPATPAAAFAVAEEPREEAMLGANRADAPSSGSYSLDSRLGILAGVSSPDDTYDLPNSTHADGNDTAPRAREPKARRMWLAVAVGVGIALVIALSILFVFTSPPSATTTAQRSGSSGSMAATATGTPREPPTATPPVVEPSAGPSGLVAVPAPPSSAPVPASTAAASLQTSTRVPTVAPPSARSPTTAPPSAPRQPATSSAAPPPTVTPTAHAPAQPPDPAPKNDIDRTLRP